MPHWLLPSTLPHFIVKGRFKHSQDPRYLFMLRYNEERRRLKRSIPKL